MEKVTAESVETAPAPTKPLDVADLDVDVASETDDNNRLETNDIVAQSDQIQQVGVVTEVREPDQNLLMSENDKPGSEAASDAAPEDPDTLQPSEMSYKASSVDNLCDAESQQESQTSGYSAESQLKQEIKSTILEISPLGGQALSTENVPTPASPELTECNSDPEEKTSLSVEDNSTDALEDATDPVDISGVDDSCSSQIHSDLAARGEDCEKEDSTRDELATPSPTFDNNPNDSSEPSKPAGLITENVECETNRVSDGTKGTSGRSNDDASGSTPTEAVVGADDRSTAVAAVSLIGHQDDSTKNSEELESHFSNSAVDCETASSNDDDANDDDLASNAAKAMAAVAAAASVNAVSPSAAAEAARALAPNVVPEAISGRNEDLSTINLSTVKTHMIRTLSGLGKPAGDPAVTAVDGGSDGNGGIDFHDMVESRLAYGENDHFLQHMLLLQYFRTEVTITDVVPREKLEQLRLENESIEHSRALASAQQVRSMLHMAEEAHDSLAALLPLMPEDEEINPNDGDSDYYGIDAPVVVPDLLPPCTSIPGDATLQFFLACLGDREKDEKVLTNEPLGKLEPLGATESSQQGSLVGDAEGELSSDAAEAAVKSAASVFTSMFSSMTRSSTSSPARSSSAFSGVFRKRTRPNEIESEKEDETRASGENELSNGEYSVSIDREMLGLTVENVLERTVVRTVLPGGAAKKAGAKVGSLIVKVGNVETKNLTHFETIDELRQSQRPLRLVLRQITSDALRSAREEMGRLIRGGGFGTSLPTEQHDLTDLGKRGITTAFRRTHHGKPANVEAFSQVLHQRWNRQGTTYLNLKEEALVHASEKLVWILTLLVIGLEREAGKDPKAISRERSFEASPGRRPHNTHVSEDYADAAKSVSKVLFDFVSAKLLAVSDPVDTNKVDEASIGNPANRFRRGPPASPPPNHASGRMGARLRLQDASIASRTRSPHNLLFRIGDVLHRTRTFLADPNSPPAALLRGEVVSFLCDILDIDTEMELSEEEAGSSTAGLSSAPINDLGSAGSLLKLIILNCSMMRSPGCSSLAKTSHSNVSDLEEEQRRRFGLTQNSNGVDLHRFHAGNRFLAVVHRLAASRSISARVTACSLGPVLWGHLDFPHQLQLRGVITRALHDVDVIVRKSTATVLHEIAELVFDPRAVPWLVLMCERAMTDPEPQLRAAAMTLTWHLSEHLPNAFLGDASQGSRSLRRLPSRSDPTFAEVYLLQCKLLPVATRLADDRAPSVRLAVAAQCDRLCNSLGEHWYSVIIDVLQALLGDPDENVRGEAILCAPRLTEIVLVTSTPERAGVGVLEALLPVSMKLIADPSPNVRIALATAAGDLLTLLVGLESIHEICPPSAGDHRSEISENAKSNKKHVDDTLIPLLQKLLQDSEPEVTSAALRAVTNASRGNVREIRARQNSRTVDDDTVSLSSYQSHTSVEKKDPVFIPVLSEEQVMRLMPTLSELANSRQWRVRQGAVEIVPALLGCTKKLQIRSEVAQLCFRLMNDRVHAVRKTAAECLCLSGGGLGSHGEESAGEWTKNVVIPHVRSCSQSGDSKQRILSLMMIEIIIVNGICPSKRKASRSGSLEDQVLVHPQLELINIAISLASDRVANVRLNFGRMASSIVSVVDDDEVGLLTIALQEQVDNERKRDRGGDRDVLFFATRAMKQVREKDDNMSLQSLQDSSRR